MIYTELKINTIFFTLDFDIALNHCVLVEWPEILEEFFPKSRIEIFFKEDKNDLRNIKFLFSDLLLVIIKKYGSS